MHQYDSSVCSMVYISQLFLSLTHSCFCSNMYTEIWLETCGVCYEEKESFYVNECSCVNLVCEQCHQCVNKCPFCRHPFMMHQDNFDITAAYPSVPAMSTQEARRARRNWNFYFDKFRGRDRMRPYVGTYWNNDSVHRILNTGHFDRLEEAGVCMDKQAAYMFVKGQLDRFFSIA